MFNGGGPCEVSQNAILFADLPFGGALFQKRGNRFFIVWMFYHFREKMIRLFDRTSYVAVIVEIGLPL